MFVNCEKAGKKFTTLVRSINSRENLTPECMALGDAGPDRAFIVLELQKLALKRGQVETTLPYRVLEIRTGNGDTRYFAGIIERTKMGVYKYTTEPMYDYDPIDTIKSMIMAVQSSKLSQEDKDLAIVYIRNHAVSNVKDCLNTVKKDVVEAVGEFRKDVVEGVGELKKEVADTAGECIDVLREGAKETVQLLSTLKTLFTGRSSK